MQPVEPNPDCSLCPRLKTFREENKTKFPDYFNAPVPAFGDLDASLLIVGLAPGLHGANKTSRPFTGDYAGELLYPTLKKFDFARGDYGATPDDGLRLMDCRITNCVRCVPPQNKPTGPETRACLPFLISEIKAMENLKAILALGKVAHDMVLTAFDERRAAWKFAHGARHPLPAGYILHDSYHCSRYNTNTGRLTPKMFEDVFHGIRNEIPA